MAKGGDTHGAPAADRPKDVRKGEQAEKGDARRPFRQHQGKTRHSTRQDVPRRDDANTTGRRAGRSEQLG